MAVYRYIAFLSLLCLFAAPAALSKTKRTIPNNLKVSKSKRQLNAKTKSLKAEIKETVEDRPRYDSPSEAEQFFLLKRLGQGQRQLPTRKYLDAAEQMKRMASHSTARESHNRGLAEISSMQPESGANLQAGLQSWTPLGPGNIGGRTRALLIDSTNPLIMYAAGVGGGVWKSVDGGANWSALTDLLPNIAVTALAMDPSNHNVIYAGTGEGYSNIDSIPGVGMFKSTDGGATWKHLQAAPDVYFTYIFKIVVSPHDPKTIYVATKMGIWITNDGEHFALIFISQDGCSDLVIRPDQASDYIYAACGLFQNATIYRNTGAQTGNFYGWQAVFSDNLMGRISLALSPSNPNIIYAMGMQIGQDHDHNFAVKEVLRSAQNGDPGSWTVQTSPQIGNGLSALLLTNPLAATSSQCGKGPNFFVNQGWYDSVLAVDPMDPNRLWAGGIDLFRSDDGGVTWGLSSYWWAKGNPQYVHADQHAIVFHPQYDGNSNRTMFVANDGGIFRTDDARASTASGPTATCDSGNSNFNWSNVNNGYDVTQFYQGAPFPNGTEYFGGTQDNGTIKGSIANGQNWNELLGGDGGFVGVNPENINVLYASTPGIALRKSIDGGSNWTKATTGIQDYGLFVTPFTLDPANPNRLWTGGAYIWRTDDGTGSWHQASTLTAGNGLVSAVAISQVDPNRVVVGMSDGWVLTNNQALTATANTDWMSRVPRSGFVSSVAFDPTSSNIIYATYSTMDTPAHSHVYKSVDFGASWQSSDGSGDEGIPDIPVNSIVIHPADPARLYAGTDSGVFVSLDGGQHWGVENTGFANVVTESLKIDASGSSLFAFTHGRGAWKVALQPQALRVSPSLVDFGLQFQGKNSAPRNVQITNVSNATVTFTSITVSGDYSQNNTCTTLLPGVSCVIAVTSTPLALGANAGSLVISSNGDGGTFTVPLKSKGYTGPAVSFSVSSLDFGSLPGGSTSAPQSVTMTNTGSADLEIANILVDVTISHFEIQSRCPDVLPAGASCVINAKYFVSYAQKETSGFIVISNASTSPDRVALSGTGLPLPGFRTYSASSGVELGTVNAKVSASASVSLSRAAVLRYDGQPRPTTISDRTATGTLTASDVQKLGNHKITIYDPAQTPQETSPENFFVYLPVQVSHLVYDPFTRLAFGPPARKSVGGMYNTPEEAAAAIAQNSTVYVVDVESGSVVKKLKFPDILGISISPDGKYLYVNGKLGLTVYRYNIQLDQVETAFDVPQTYGNGYIENIVGLPTDDRAVLVASYISGLSLYRDGVRSPLGISDFVSQYSAAFGNGQIRLGDPLQALIDKNSDNGLLPNGGSAVTGYSTDYWGTLHSFKVDSQGISSHKTQSALGLSEVQYDNGKLYASSGYVFDPDTLQKMGRYQIFGYDASVRAVGTPYPDSARGLVQFVDPTGMVRLYDQKSFDLLQERPFSNFTGELTKTGPSSFLVYHGDGFTYNNVSVLNEPTLNPYTAPQVPSLLTGISPSSGTVNGGNFLLQATGSGFTPGSVLMWNGQRRTTRYISPSSIVGYIPASDLAQPGTVAITIYNPETPQSQSQSFTISPAPVSISPGGLGFGLAIPGRGSQWKPVEVRNNTAAAIKMGDVSVSNNKFSVSNNCPVDLPSGAACALAVRFTPQSVGEQYGVLSVQAGTQNPMTIPISGTGFDFTIQLSRPTRPHRSAAQPATSSTTAIEVSLTSGSATPQVAQLGCSVPSRDYSCRVSPSNAVIGGPSVNATVTVESRRARRLASKPSATLPITITATTNGVERTTVVQ